MQNELRVKRIGDHRLPLPEQAHVGDAGFDLRSTINVTIFSDEQTKISCGFAFEIPKNMVGIIKDKSSMANTRLYISGGVIDSSYRGEVQILIRNDDGAPHRISIGDKITQMVIVPYYKANCVEVKDISRTARGADGFGSTGK